MRNVMLGLGLGVCLGGCLGMDDAALEETPPGGELTAAAEGELGAAPRVGRFDRTPPAALPQLSSTQLSADDDLATVLIVRARFDPQSYRRTAAFRAKLEVKR
jgi:hypothetical protein